MLTAPSLATPSYDTGSSLAYNGIRPELGFRLERLRRSRTDSRMGKDAGQTHGNVDVVVSNGAYATFRAGYFHDRYTDTGISDTTSYTYQTSRPA